MRLIQHDSYNILKNKQPSKQPGKCVFGGGGGGGEGLLLRFSGYIWADFWGQNFEFIILGVSKKI